ncbi:outer membrane protein [Bradyrhizobium sp. SZCCHNPS2010]|uniref:outer membrane protein n=1 Tax=Bradyrhizobium sp. SZCCHNPS2010 TaxID=3057333 RepID=UPI0029165D15|nr:outer membrane beta-barrel protein [Bradyrhizobium sp. SZCCHNPS2010]
MWGMLLGAATLLALGAAPAIAADLPARTYTKAPAMLAAIYDWGGFYVGLNAGGGSAHTCWTNTATGTSEGCHNATGALAGGQIGYRWQNGAFVFGLEAQGNWADLKGSNGSQALAATTNQTKIDSVGLFTGQVGYAWNNALWYVKGGAAVVGDKYNGLATVAGTVFDRAAETRWGGTVGTGIEVGFAPNWSVAAEYDHIFMGNRALNFSGVPAGAASRGETVSQDADLATLRVNYRWGGPVVAKH